MEIPFQDAGDCERRMLSDPESVYPRGVEAVQSEKEASVFSVIRRALS